MLEFFLGVLFQYQTDPVRASELAQKALRSETRAQQESANKRALAERRRFQEKYDAVSRAMEEFALAYNAGRGDVWPKKEAAALAKAIREFESTVTWRPLSRSSSNR
jgi:hypothetical protein